MASGHGRIAATVRTEARHRYSGTRMPRAPSN